jgi:hypothetical protein
MSCSHDLMSIFNLGMGYIGTIFGVTLALELECRDPRTGSWCGCRFALGCDTELQRIQLQNIWPLRYSFGKYLTLQLMNYTYLKSILVCSKKVNKYGMECSAKVA